MAGFPTPITNENFPQAWRVACRKYKNAKVNAAIRKIAKPIGEVLFFPLFLMLAFGAAVSFTPPSIQALIGRLPVIPGLWQKLEATVFGSADTVLDLILRSALFLYAIPLAVFLITALIIRIVYRPKTYPTTGNAYQDGHALWTMARHALTDSKRKGKDVTGTLGLITGIIAVLGTLAVIFFCLPVSGGEDMLNGIGVVNALKLFGLALILIFAYIPAATPLDLLMKLFCATHVSKRIPESAEDYCRGLRRGPVPVNAEPAAPAAEEKSAETPAEKPDETPAEAPAE